MTQDERPPLVYVVEDDDALRDSLCWLIESAGYRVAAFSSAEHFLAYVEPGTGACVVLDVRMPGMNGLELQERLIKRQLHVPVIFITGHGDVPMAVHAIKRGAIDFLEKPFQDHELLARISGAARSDQGALKGRARQRLMTSQLTTLSQREREVMERVVDGKPNKCIADELGISIKTVEAHRSRMMRKLGANSIAELVRLSVGWTSPGPML
ncbi:MAG: DNA-binding response regulator [Betaproteobacteria bacterium RIFCSPLOWO2_02_FULL_67_26]|nr:MAG: DNA-binding response regulator [Betaproteobacteria bacterium RIFCSPLOWO2_02_FULL_67_26]